MMEAVWDDLNREAPDLVLPQWHGPALAEPESTIGRVDDQPVEWDYGREKTEKEIR